MAAPVLVRVAAAAATDCGVDVMTSDPKAAFVDPVFGAGVIVVAASENRVTAPLASAMGETTSASFPTVEAVAKEDGVTEVTLAEVVLVMTPAVAALTGETVMSADPRSTMGAAVAAADGVTVMVTDAVSVMGVGTTETAGVTVRSAVAGFVTMPNVAVVVGVINVSAAA